jgi:hypothetical protein
MADYNTESARIRKSVSFAASNQFYLIEYQEPLVVDDDHSYQSSTEIETMIAGDEISSNFVCYDTLDKLSAGTALDTSDFKTFPQRLSKGSSGPGDFSMDEVIRRLFAFQESTASLQKSSELSDNEQSNIGDTSTDESLSHQQVLGEKNHDEISHEALPWSGKIQSLLLDYSTIEDNAALERANTDRQKHFNMSPPESAVERTPVHALTEHRKHTIQPLESDIPDGIGTTPQWIVDARNGNSPNASSSAPCGITIDTTLPDTSDYRSAGHRPHSSPLKLSQTVRISPSDSLSPAQLRRHGRVSKQLSKAVDISNGIVKYCVKRVILRIVVIWIILPAGLCILSYGVIPYDYFDDSTKLDMSSGALTARTSDRVVSSIWAPTLVPWILIMSCVGSLSIEIYSYVVAEIEFGIVLWTTSLRSHFFACIISVTLSICTQAVIFEADRAGCAWNWLAVMVVGVLSTSAVLCFIFLRSRSSTLSKGSPESLEATISFIRFLLGNGLLIGVSGAGYTMYAVVYAQYSCNKGNAVGIALAFLFPFLRLLLNAILQNCKGIQWGSSKGFLCAGMVVAILSSMWHTAFGCLIIGASSTVAQCVTIALVEILIQGRALSDIIRNPYLEEGKLDLDMPVESDLKMKGTNRSPQQPQLSASWRSKGSIVVDCPSQCSRDILLGRGTIDFRNFALSSDCPAKLEESPSMSRETSITMNANSLSTPKLHRSRPRTEEAREIQLSNWLVVTWTNGILTPLCFLACAAALSSGCNKRLFALEVVNADSSNIGSVLTNTSNWELRAHLHRVWSLNTFNAKQGPSRLVYKMLLISAFHVALSITGIAIMSTHKVHSFACKLLSSIGLKGKAGTESEQSTSNRNSRTHGDLLGLMSTLLEKHYNVMALSSVMTLSIVLSVVFPWYGMNNSF